MGFQFHTHRQNGNLKCISYLFLLLWFSAQGISALRCYQCISVECSESQLFCGSVKEYAISRLPDLYYGYTSQNVPLCPSPNDDDDGWTDLQKETTYECEEEKEDDATCVLGRFRVTTEIYDTGKNITSHGISMGCANAVLMRKTRESKKKGTCDMSSSTSRFKNGLRHFLEVEHCARPPEMCHDTDFCIPPHATRVKSFKDESNQRSFNFTYILGIFLILAMAVIVLTFLAPFCNG